MSLFQNTTLHPIPLMLNGIRKTIRPGEQFSGPENMSSIPGITLVNQTTKTVIQESKNKNLDVNIIPQNFMQINKPMETNIKNFKEDIDYLEHMKSLGSSPSVTIAILTKNRFDLIKNCCESIFEKVLYPNVTLMIIDTGTTEKDVKIYYETLNEKCNKKNWKYKFIQLSNYHYSKNYNEAINNNVDTEFVLIQNNDTVALNDYVTKMIRIAIIRKVGSVGCRMVYPDLNSIQHDGQTIFNAANEQFGSASHIHLRVNKNEVAPDYSNTHFVDGNTAAGVLLRTEDFKKIKGFDEKFSDIFQDVHLMIKIPQLLNRFNYCNRKANIIHLDNASRLQTGIDQQKHVQMWEDTHYLRKILIENRWGKLKKPKNYDFSIITCIYDLENYKKLVKCIESQLGNYNIELISIPNFFNTFDSAYNALNAGADIASGNILIYCHDDIEFANNWLNKVKDHIEALKSQKIPIGVLGPAGITKTEQSSYYLIDENQNKISKNDPHILASAPRYQVQTLDEMCLITLKTNDLRFDDSLMSGWHFYGANICLKALSKGLNNFSIDAYVYHKSDGIKNLNTLEKYKQYEECAKRFDTWAKNEGFLKWRTTTAKCENNNLHLYPNKPIS